MKKIKVGDLVVYEMKNEIGLVGEVIDKENVRCWWHMGGTRAVITVSLVYSISLEQAKLKKFSNQYAFQSILNRRVELLRQMKVNGNKSIPYDELNPLFDYME